MLGPSDLSPAQVQAVKDLLNRKILCNTSDCGFGKCLSPDTGVMMLDGTIREVKDIQVGEMLLGDDNTPRRVLSKHIGHSKMYEVIPTKGDSWKCNDRHTLCTVSCSRTSFGAVHQYINVDVNDYLKLNKTTKAALKQYAVGFDGWKENKNIPYDLYLLGVWLGDGTTISTGITNSDVEIQTYIKDFAKKNNLRCREEIIEGKAPQFHLVTKLGQPNPFRTYLRKNLLKNGKKIIPKELITTSREQRLDLLAGLLDTDGHYFMKGFEIIQKQTNVADGIATIARSLGFFVTKSIKIINGATYYRCYISGDLDEIPTKVERKQATSRKINKNHLRTGFSLKAIGEGPYVGLEVDGNKKFLLHDFTVSHNTITGLTAVGQIRKRHPGIKTLILSTPKGVKNVWSKEHLKWSHTKQLNIIPLIGPPAKRLKLLEEDADAYVISYNMLEWLMNNNPHQFGFTIGDEAECLKGSVSKWRRYLSKVSKHTKYRYLMSATPKPREEDDYWGLAKYLDGGKRLGETIGAFRALYMENYTLERRVIWKVRKAAIPLIEDKIKDIFINYDLSDQATIPVKTITCYGKLSNASAEKYRLLEKDQTINSVIKDQKREPLSSLTISNKLDQFASGFLYIDDNLRITVETLRKTTSVRSLLNKSKRKIAVDVFDDRIVAFGKMLKLIEKKHGAHQNICVCYYFKHELNQLKRLLPDGVSDHEDDIEDRWNRGEIKHLFLQYGRSARALNLQGGGFIMAFYTLTFKWGDMYQIVRRLARQGQQAPVVWAYRLYMRGTVDDMKTKKLSDRFKGHSRFQALIRSEHLSQQL